MKIRKAVILAAGLGTRFFPITKSVDKEMLPIIDKPCIQYLVEEAASSGIQEIIFITAPGRSLVKDYFSASPKLYLLLKKKGKLRELNSLKKLDKIAKFKFVTQPHPGGDGHAILCAKKYIGKEPFAVLFGDDIYDSKTPAIAQLIKQYEKHEAPIIGLTKINKKDSDKYGIIKGEKCGGGLHKVKALVEKPSPSAAPSNLAIIGKYIVTPSLFKDLEKARPFSSELRLIDGMIRHIKISPIYAYELRGHRFDTGDKSGYLKAVMHFGLKKNA
jgi:UTP--glucose-1-phosphate uridylyltransferase